ncbi:MAG: hypothetical protein V7609_2123 [Verrucomicrobiota bacterium]
MKRDALQLLAPGAAKLWPESYLDRPAVCLSERALFTVGNILAERDELQRCHDCAARAPSVQRKLQTEDWKPIVWTRMWPATLKPGNAETKPAR